MLLAAFSNIINIGRPIPNSDLTVKKFQSKQYPILVTRMSVFIIIHWGRLINNANDIHICRNSLIAELSQNNVRQFQNNTTFNTMFTMSFIREAQKRFQIGFKRE